MTTSETPVEEGSRAPARDGRGATLLRLGLLGAWALATLAMMVHVLVDTFARTRAVPPEEFPAAEILFGLAPTARAIHLGGVVAVALLAGLDAARRVRSGRGAVRPVLLALALAALGMLASLAHGLGALLTALALFAVHAADAAHALERERPAGATAAVTLLGELRARHLARHAAGILGLPAAAYGIAVGLELVLYTRDFAGRFFALSEFHEFVLLALAGALVAGARLGLELALLVLMAAALVREASGRAERALAHLRLAAPALALALLTTTTSGASSILLGLVLAPQLARAWLATRPAPARLVAPAFALGLYLWARTADLFLAALGHEVAALGLTWMVHLLFGLLGILFASWTRAGLRAALERHAPQRLREVLGLCALAFCCPVLAPLARRSRAATLLGLMRRATPLALAFLGAWLLLLVELNYPSFTDFSQFLQRLYSMLIGAVGAAMLVVVCLAALPAARRARPLRQRLVGALALVLLAAALAAYLGLRDRQVPRMIGGQYSKIAWRALELAQILPAPSRIPLGAGDDPGPAPELARQATLPHHDLALYRERRPPIFVIVWDAARHDHMSVYGYPRETTPGAAALARDAVVFDQAYSSATGTTASLRHLFSGRFSSRYMLADDHAPFFTGRLCAEGYDAFVLNILGSDFNGVSRDAFLRNQPLEARTLAACEAATREFGTYEEQAKVAAALEQVDAHLAARAGQPHPGDGLFVFLHMTATHWPWLEWDDAPDFGDALVDRYDGAMFHADKATRDFLDGLRQRGLYDDAVVVLTADHGTGLDDHGRYGGFEPYQEQIRVPLLIKAPGIAPRRVATAVSGIDLAPTLVGLVAPGEPNPYDGFSLLEPMLGRSETLARRYLLSLSAFDDALALIDLERELKLHLHRTDRYEMLYDLRSDPGERVNLADAHPEVVAEYVALLRRWLWHDRHGLGNPYHYRELEVD